MKRVAGRAGRQLHLREIHRADGRADVGIVDQLARDLVADALLRLLGRAADMRRQDDVGQALQRRDETLGVRGRLDREDVDGGARADGRRASPSASASRSTTRPRELLIRKAPGFIARDLAPRRSCQRSPASPARAA